MGQAFQGGMQNTGTPPPSPTAPGGGSAATARLPDVMTPAQAAGYLQITEADIMTMIEAGDIKAKKLGASFRVAKKAIDEYMAS